MGLPYLKLFPEEAIKTLEECIVLGYQVRDQIIQQYNSLTGAENPTLLQPANHHIMGYQKLADEWGNSTLQKLDNIFVSQRELYNFRDAQAPTGATSANVHWFEIIHKLKARIDKLNEYDRYIRDEFNVKIEYIGRDKIVQNGDKGTVEIKN
jgi:hypothetical protein